MITKTPLLVFAIALVLPIISAQVNNSQCNRTCGSDKAFPYPFGFSSGCEIELNCTQGAIFVGEFPVRSVDQDAMIVNVIPKCNRPIDSFRQLFGYRYAPTKRNTLLLHNCSSRIGPCMISATMVQTKSESPDCNYDSDNSSCYFERTTEGFMQYANVTRSGCRYLMSSISADYVSNSLSGSTSLEVGTIELAWWLEGECYCSADASCTKFHSPMNGRSAYRCRCNEGFIGDGYSGGAGCRKVSEEKSAITPIAAAVSAIVGVGVVGVLIFVIYCCRFKLARFWKNRSNAHQDFEAFLKSHGPLAVRRYNYSDLKKMTRSFKEKLGQGGYGGVFKGKLDDGCLVAVKILNESKGNGEEFINEVASISRTSHVNIVTLLGFCFEGSKRALVYEFMPNGSLEKFIYETNPLKSNHRLDTEVLYQIAIGVAQGLEYLHKGCNTRILHFDIKPHNILLDENFCPKISDFGLAKICLKKESIVSMLGAIGTIGYIAPEVFNRNFGEVSYKSDIFSYGMMVLEMVGGRKNINVEVDHTSEIYFPQWVYKRLELNEEFSLRNITNDNDKDRIRKMVIVSLWCIQTNPVDRPTMRRVVEMLEGRVETLQIPPKPFLSSPPRTQPSSSTR